MRALRPELRMPRTWMMGGCFLLLLATVVCLMPADDVPDTHVSDKLEHALGFVPLALWFGGISRRQRYLTVALALITFGGLIELAQGLIGWGRNADWLDLCADVAGVAAGLLLALTPLGRWADLLEILLRKRAP